MFVSIPSELGRWLRRNYAEILYDDTESFNPFGARALVETFDSPKNFIHWSFQSLRS